MMVPVPTEPKIYHIVHVDRLPSIIADGHLWCDAVMARRGSVGTTIGMSSIKQRRLNLTLRSHPGLHVGGCVPFYFCPRSVMLYVIHRGNAPELTYRGGQQSVVHLEADLREAVAWAESNGRRWAFTTSNAASSYFRDYADLGQLHRIDWAAVQTDRWSGPGAAEQAKESKQAEFLMETAFPWELTIRIGVGSRSMQAAVMEAVQASAHRPAVAVVPDWYY